MFEKYGYPEIDDHKATHKDLVAQVLSFPSDFQTGKATVSMDLMGFLKDWLKNHSLKTDVGYVPFISQAMKKG